jgi:hypothetical protein
VGGNPDAPREDLGRAGPEHRRPSFLPPSLSDHDVPAIPDAAEGTSKAINHQGFRGTRDGVTGDGAASGSERVSREAGKAAVGSEHDIGIENGDERVEVTVSGGGKEGLDDLPLGG